MTTATRFKTGGNFGSPKIDLGGCVFYAPLWRPDLAGSPFQSPSPYGIPSHTCTVTGATWGIQGRTFAGGDDLIELNDGSTASPLNFTSGDFSIIIRMKTDNLTGANNLFNRGAYNDTGYWFRVGTNGSLDVFTFQTVAGQSSASSAGSIVVGTWYTVGFSRAGASVKLFINGVEDTASPGSHTNPATCALAGVIGSYQKSSDFFYGTIGEVIIYNRALSAGEIMNNYLATKWRY